MVKMDLWPQPLKKEASKQIRACVIRVTSNDQSVSEETLWFEYPESLPSLASADCDAYLLASLLPAMKQAADIHVHGSVSGELLANLAELQLVWAKWCPELYREVAVSVDTIRENDTPLPGTVAAFSGGADAQFTAYRHASGKAGHATRNMSAGIFVHGFDIPLENVDGFASAAELAQRALNDLNIELITVRTNARDISPVNWEHYFGTAVGAVLNGAKGMAGTGLIASDEPYDSLVAPWGSHPLTNPMLSSQDFRILHDGSGYNRSEKISSLAEWHAGIKNLRVCWAGGRYDRNCGVCEKCVRTRLNFLLAGVEQPACFDTPLTKRCLSSVALRNDGARNEWRLIHNEMLRTGIGKHLLKDVEKVIKRPATQWGTLLPSGSRRREMVKRMMGKS